MFISIYQYELKYWLKQPATYIYAILFFLFSWAAGTGNAESIDTRWTGKMLNSSLMLYRTIGFFEVFIALFSPAIIGLALYRDFSSNMHHLLYAYPFQKRDYLLGKLLSCLTIVFLIVSFIGVGVYLGTIMPWVQPDSIYPFQFSNYAQIFFGLIFPNILVIGILIFSIVGWTRNIYTGFIAAILFILIKEGLGSIINPMEQPIIAGLLDSSGKTAIQNYSQFWTVAEQNLNPLPLTGIVIWNRVLWLALAIILFIKFYFSFQFHHNGVNFWSLIPAKSKALAKKKFREGSIQKIRLPKISYHHSFQHQLKTCWYLSKVDLKYIISHPPFILLILTGFFALLFMVSKGMIRWETENLPLTRIMLDIPLFIFSAVTNIITFLYAGLLINRARIAYTNQLVDVNPIPNWVLILSKFIAIVFIQIMLLSLIMFGGLITQITKGYDEFEIGLYLFELFAVNLIHFIIWGMLAVFIQTIIRNPYLGFFLLLCAPAGFIGLADFGPKIGLHTLEQGIFRYNQGPGAIFGLPYSDLDGYGSSLFPYFTYKVYWLIAGLMLLLSSACFWVRGITFSFIERWYIARRRVSGRIGWLMSILFISFMGFGFSLFQEENVAHDFYSRQEKMDLLVAAEKKYKAFQFLNSPHIIAVKMEMDLFPENRNFTGQGQYTIVNESKKPIDTIAINYKAGLHHQYSFNQPYDLISSDKIANMAHFDLIKLHQPMAPKDTLTMNFSLDSKQNGWLYQSDWVKQNGTYINDEICPRFGNWLSYLRKDLGMNQFIEAPHPMDTIALQKQEQRRDSRMIQFEAIVSTSKDQIAIAPGNLEKKWKANERNYYHYKTPKPIAHSFLFLSGNYELVKDDYNNIDIEIYFQKGHLYNIDRMMEGLKAGLEYCSNNFSPYQFEALRLVEFAQTKGVTAHGFPGVIPTGEGAGFTAHIDGCEHGGVDFAFGTAVHEVAHQWWGHQVIPAEAKGSKMIVESMAEYVNICLKEKYRGMEEVRTYLKLEMENYLRRRTKESNVELPLMYANPQQNYIHYPKGVLVFHALKSYLGEEKLNHAIGKFVKAVAFRKDSLTTSIELLNHLENEVPDSLKYLIEDLFKNITIYHNSISKASLRVSDKGNYHVHLDLVISKYQSEGKGNKIFVDQNGNGLQEFSINGTNQSSLPLADYVEIGFADQEGIFEVKRIKVTSISNVLKFQLNRKPTKVIIDPNYLLIDDNLRDNEWVLE